VPLATAHEKGYDGGSTTARRRSEDSRAISLPTGGPGCSEAPPSVAPRRGSTQQRCCMKRVSRAGSHPLEVPDGRDVSPLLWPRRPQKDGRGVPHYEYGGTRACARGADLPHDDGRPVSNGRLAPGGGVDPRGDGKHGGLLAPSLQSPKASLNCSWCMPSTSRPYQDAQPMSKMRPGLPSCSATASCGGVLSLPNHHDSCASSRAIAAPWCRTTRER